MNDSIITPINIISLDSATYGDDLNDRLEIINNNFTKIIQSDFLQGIPGNTIGIICVNFDETVPNDESNFATVDNDTSIIQVPNHLIDNGTTSDLYYYYPTQDDENYIGVTIDNLKGKLKEAIINNPNDTTRYDLINLDGYSITLYYEYNVTIGKYFLVSSLPFIYYDKYALDELVNNTDNTEVEDLSCALVYSKNEDEYGFRSIHPFPQIYYDRNQSNGNLCWKINGIETGISCQGIQGTNGRNGSTYMAYVDTKQLNKEGLNVSEIYGILKLKVNTDKPTTYIPSVIKPSEFKDKGIFIEQGDVLICVPATIDSENNYKPSNGGVYISIAHIIQNEQNENGENTQTYYVLSDERYISYITPLDTNAVGLLYNGLSCIGFNGSDNVKPLQGLFIPTGLTNTSSENGEGTEDTPEKTISGHMLWASKEETNDKDINILNISHVKNVDDPIVDEDVDTELKIDYNVIRLGLTENSTVHVNDLHVNDLHVNDIYITDEKLINGLIEIKYDDLKTQRDNGKLCPGQLYRITDYITTITPKNTPKNTISAGYQFDIIVLALSTNTLSEDAWAAPHDFSNNDNNVDMTLLSQGYEFTTSRIIFDNYTAINLPKDFLTVFLQGTESEDDVVDIKITRINDRTIKTPKTIENVNIVPPTTGDGFTRLENVNLFSATDEGRLLFFNYYDNTNTIPNIINYDGISITIDAAYAYNYTPVYSFSLDNKKYVFLAYTGYKTNNVNERYIVFIPIYVDTVNDIESEDYPQIGFTGAIGIKELIDDFDEYSLLICLQECFGTSYKPIDEYKNIIAYLNGKLNKQISLPKSAVENTNLRIQINDVDLPYNIQHSLRCNIYNGATGKYDTKISSYKNLKENYLSNHFENSNLSAWKLRYCLDNDKDRFAWVDDTDTGRGVIYRMIDEFGNDCPYDFKNIMFYCPDFDDDLEFYYTFNGFTFSTLEGEHPHNKEDWSLFGNVKNNRVYYNNYNGISKILFRSSVDRYQKGKYCCNNNIINSYEIIIHGRQNNTVMGSHDIEINGDNCNIHAGSVNSLINKSSVTYLGDIETYDDCGLLNNIRTSGNQIMIIPSMKVNEVNGDTLEINGNYEGLNFSISEHVRKIGNLNSFHYCIQIPNNVSTVIIYGSLKDSKISYIELPREVPLGHTIEFIEPFGHSEKDYGIMAPPTHNSNDSSYYIYSNGATNEMNFNATKENPIIIYDSLYPDGGLSIKYILLPENSRKRVTYVGGDPNDSNNLGTWIC